MAKYAQYTSVSVARSRTQIEDCLERYGASSFVSGWDRARGISAVGFEFNGLVFRIEISIPADCTAQEERQRWRVLLLVLKAKLEAVECGISTVEEEFLAYVMTPGGTLGKRLLPQLNGIAKSGAIPPLLGVTPVCVPACPGTCLPGRDRQAADRQRTGRDELGVVASAVDDR